MLHQHRATTPTQRNLVENYQNQRSRAGCLFLAWQGVQISCRGPHKNAPQVLTIEAWVAILDLAVPVLALEVKVHHHLVIHKGRQAACQGALLLL